MLQQNEAGRNRALKQSVCTAEASRFLPGVTPLDHCPLEQHSGGCDRSKANWSRDPGPLMARVLIATSVRLFREGLAEILERRTGFCIVGTASHAAETLEQVADHKPDVALVDVAMPDSLACVRAMIRLSPETKVLALGVADDAAGVVSCAEAGVSGFVPRDGSLDDLVSAVECVARGELACSPRSAAVLLRQVGALSLAQATPRSIPALTVRELDVLRLLDRRLTNKEIARELGIEVATVKNHVHNLMEKLQVHRRRDVAATANVRFGA
jgi:two-component system nitrate/nitrite response regulator NarL